MTFRIVAVLLAILLALATCSTGVAPELTKTTTPTVVANRGKNSE